MVEGFPPAHTTPGLHSSLFSPSLLHTWFSPALHQFLGPLPSPFLGPLCLHTLTPASLPLHTFLTLLPSCTPPLHPSSLSSPFHLHFPHQFRGTLILSPSWGHHLPATSPTTSGTPGFHTTCTPPLWVPTSSHFSLTLHCTLPRSHTFPPGFFCHTALFTTTCTRVLTPAPAPHLHVFTATYSLHCTLLPTYTAPLPRFLLHTLFLLPGSTGLPTHLHHHYHTLHSLHTHTAPPTRLLHCTPPHHAPHHCLPATTCTHHHPATTPTPSLPLSSLHC